MPDISKEEYVEFLKYKKEKVEKELQAIEDSISKLIGITDNSQQPVVLDTPKKLKVDSDNRTAVGWKYIIDAVMMHENRPLTAAEIVELVSNHPNYRHLSKTAKKSVGSTLSVNSKDSHDRYLFKKVAGIKYYHLNKEHKEK